MRGLAALAALLAALAVWQVAAGLEPEDPHGIAMPVRPPGTSGQATAPAAGAVTDTSAILERPLFAQARRRMAPIAEAQAAAPPPAAAPEAPPLSATHQLIGLFRVDDRVTALLRPAQGGTVLRLQSGEALAGWTLVGTAPDLRRAALFARAEEGERQVLVLPAAAGRPAGAGRGGEDDDDDED